MGYRDYSKSDFENLSRQINIMALFGNGVDIQLTEYLDLPYRTTYQDFYNYLCNKNFDNSNLLFKKMQEDKESNKDNWSDFENSLIELVEDTGNNLEDLKENLKVFQIEFSNFLNEIITPSNLAKLGTEATENKTAISTFENILGDLSEKNYKKIHLVDKMKYQIKESHCLFNWEILNFNYTSLLDNVLNLDREQYDPHKFKRSDRQITFNINPKGYDSVKTWGVPSYLMVNIDHPHGYQNIPKSILFGFDNVEQPKKYFGSERGVLNEEDIKPFLKPYWAQNDKKYKSYFQETDLFIIYGLSLGKTDFWWWNNIFNALLETDAELIIYNYDKDKLDDEDEHKHKHVINNFIEKAKGIDRILSSEEATKLHGKIAVVNYNSKTELQAFKLSSNKSKNTN
ncbi:AbiH family protein [Streptococcus sp. sy010]|uniref:AbiH family protein n=1 Tax=Streptococcus sp. sy010 TaxID=2600148 RepID=UPI0011B53DCD|nr:AbiH family protein [Streptococcus sp. sy010]TWT16527.1 hypothetical protein FRX51_01030 [Streptococcus sp. sy010]